MAEQYYIVRCDRAGVFFGRITDRRGNEVDMADVRKVWYWSGAAAVEQLAMDGVKNPEACRITVEVPQMTVMEAIQIIPCTDEATECLRSVALWKM